jgi:acyl-CoA hydrolase
MFSVVVVGAMCCTVFCGLYFVLYFLDDVFWKSIVVGHGENVFSFPFSCCVSDG